MKNKFPKAGRVPACALTALLALCASGAHAESSLISAIEQGKPIVDLRARYEGVDDASKPLDASAVTFRGRIGYETGMWNGISVLAELDQIWALADDYNSTRNGKFTYPVIADPAMTALNRLQLTFAPDESTKIILGRQRLLLGDQRFIGNAGWRQHEQTFDALTVTNASVASLALSYSYVERVNRVFGPADPKPAAGPAGAFHCDCHLLDAVYTGLAPLKLEAFGYLLDLSPRHGPAAAMLATSKLSTATYGARADYQIDLAQGISAQFMGEYAHQSAYRNNPLSLDLNYWRGEAGIGYDGLTGMAGYEAMQGNGVAGFSTPLATIHAFDGWADMFLTTPANGLDNLYFKASYVVPRVAETLNIKSVTATVIYRDFTADKTGIGIGTEWDGALDIAIDKRASLLLQYADYQGTGIGLGGFAGKSIFWVQAAYKY